MHDEVKYLCHNVRIDTCMKLVLSPFRLESTYHHSDICIHIHIQMCGIVMAVAEYRSHPSPASRVFFSN